MNTNTPLWMDSPERYGLVSRILHWAVCDDPFVENCWSFTGA
jgi:hypothetical protein